MLKEIKQNRIYELVELLGKKEIEPSEIKDKETRDVQLEKEGVNLYTEFIRFRQGIELIKDRTLEKGDLNIYLQSLIAYMNELRKCGFIRDSKTSAEFNM